MSAVPQIEYFDDESFDPFTLDDAIFGDVEDVYAIIDRARANGPVQPGTILEMLGAPPDNLVAGIPQFLVIGRPEVETILRNAALFSNDVIKRNLGVTFGNTISAMNPPEHTQKRRYFQQAFMPRQVAIWSDSLVDPVVNDLIGQFVDRGSAELVEEFAKRYPFEIIYRQLDLPQRDIRSFHRLAVTQTFISDYIRYGIEASRKLGTYFTALIAERRRHPGTDLVSIMANAVVDGQPLEDDIIISFFRQLINAAGDTTYRATGCMMIALLSNPDQFDAVRNDRSLIPKVLEETLRWNPPIVFTQRTVMEDTELGGVHLPAGAVVNVSFAAANNDPQFVEEPRRFNLFRASRSHFGFGMGAHMCVGQHLARLEMNRALTAVLDRLPNLRLDPTKPKPSIRGGLMRTPRDVHVLFGNPGT
jgi:cytochrome P450